MNDDIIGMAWVRKIATHEDFPGKPTFKTPQAKIILKEPTHSNRSHFLLHVWLYNTFSLPCTHPHTISSPLHSPPPLRLCLPLLRKDRGGGGGGGEAVYGGVKPTHLLSILFSQTHRTVHKEVKVKYPAIKLQVFPKPGSTAKKWSLLIIGGRGFSS